MNHKKCGSKLILDCTSMYTINSPSMKVTMGGILPGVIQVDELRNGKPVLRCPKCHETFSKKDEYIEELICDCSICGHDYPPSEIKVSDALNGIYICVHCIARSEKNESGDRMLALYGNLIKKSNSRLLLEILLNK